MRDVFISIITPTRNMGHFLPGCIESVRAQNYPNFEQIVVDANSSDDTANVLDRYACEPWFSCVSEPDNGQSDAINKGIARAGGDVVTWLNADDLLCPGALRSVADAFTSGTKPEFVGGTGYLIDRNGRKTREVRFQPYQPGFFRNAMKVLQPSVFFTKELFHRVGGLDTDLCYAMDWDLYLRMEKTARIMMIREPLAMLRQYPETKTASGGRVRAQELARIGYRHHGFLDRNWISYKARTSLMRITGSVRFIGYLDALFMHCWGRDGYMIKGTLAENSIRF